MPSARRNAKAAKRFFKKVLKSRRNQQPRVINTDKDKAYPPAIRDLKLFATEPQLSIILF
jgi:IS6 family transposase